MPYVFAYGSLMHPASAAHTLRRQPARKDLAIAHLAGWKRKWQLASPLPESERDSAIVFLDVVPARGAPMNGILLPVDDEELAWVDERERHYERLNVAESVAPSVEDFVYLYIGKTSHTTPPAGSVVLREYEKTIAGALELWGPDFTEAYQASTLPHEFPLSDRPYRRTPRQE